jgi:hypothetical protein
VKNRQRGSGRPVRADADADTDADTDAGAEVGVVGAAGADDGADDVPDDGAAGRRAVSSLHPVRARQPRSTAPTTRELPRTRMGAG